MVRICLKNRGIVMNIIKNTVHTNIESANIIKALIQSLSSISKSLSTGIDALIKSGANIDHMKQEPDGTIKFTILTGGNHEVLVTCVQDKNNKDKFDVHVECKIDGYTWEDDYSNIDGKNIEKVVFTFIDDYLAESVEDIIENAIKTGKITYVKMKRIFSSEQDIIKVKKIYGYESLPSMISNIETVVNDDSFAGSIPESDQWYAITDNDEEDLEVELVPTNNDMYNELENGHECLESLFPNLLVCLLNAKNTLQYIHWNFRGTNFNDVHTYTDQLVGQFEYMIDGIGELCAENGIEVPNLSTLNIGENYEAMVQDCIYSYGYNLSISDSKDAFRSIKTILLVIIKCLKYVYYSFDSSVQSLLDDWILRLSKDANYFIDHRIEN